MRVQQTSSVSQYVFTSGTATDLYSWVNGNPLATPYIYVLGRTQNLSSGAWDYVYLSYDATASADPLEHKVTRWQPGGYFQDLPADCFYHTPLGDSVPAGPVGNR